MSDKLTAIKIKQPDGTYSDQILISVLAENVRYDATKGLIDQLNYLDGRISNIIAASSGSVSTQLDQDLIDIKVGNDGVTYNTPGDAVRANDQKALNTVLVQSSQPTAAQNKLWIQQTNNDEIEILTMDDLTNVVAAQYDNQSTYAIGDYVLHEGGFYRCKIAIDTAEEWTSGHWTEVKIADEVTDLKSALNYGVLNGDNLLKSETIYSNNNTAIVNNTDGTYTVGTSDYGITIFGAQITLPPGVYTLFGSPSGVGFVSTDETYQNRFIENNKTNPKTFVIDDTTNVYVGYRITSTPSESFLIAPYLKASLPYTNNIKKLDKPDNAGTEGQVLTFNSNGKAVWSDVSTDKTLSQSNKSADAKVTGDKIVHLKNINESIIGKVDLGDTNWTEGYFISPSGDISPYPTSKYSNLIPVKYFVNYMLSVVNTASSDDRCRIHGYSSNGTWLKQIDYKTLSAGQAYDLPFKILDDSIKYIRLSLAILTKVSYLREGNTISNDIDNIKNKIYYTKRNYETWILGELNSNGTINTNSAGLRTSFIYLTENASVQISKTGYKFNLARYSSEDTSNFISGSYKSASSGNSLFVDDAGYHIISIWHTDNSSFTDTSESSVVRITDESTVLTYSDYKRSDLYRPNIRFGNVPSNYYSGLLAGFSADNLSRQTTASDMFDLFNELVDGTYITKKDLGLCSDGTQHIYEYDLIPTQCDLSVEGISYIPKTMPKILITSAQHGFEKGSVYGLYYLINDIVTNWSNDPILDYLRNHVQIKIIPICNPYGFDENSYYNYNGVNLNRSYDTPGFDGTATQGTSSYGGTTPENEAETKAICHFVRDNIDATFLLDFHTNGQWAVTDQDKINWLDFAPIADPLFEKFKYVAQTHIETLSMHFSDDYNLTENSMVGHVTSGDSGYTADFPSVDCWALIQGLCGHTIEGFCGFPAGSLFTEDVCKANAEIIGNWIISVINYLNNLSD